jgi:23S rRNA (pseudouridine1915-N3)-methyltransferase
VGRDRSGLYAPAVEEYARRISRYVKFALEEVPEARRAAGTPRARDEEAEGLLDRIEDGERVVLLDERGKEPTSVELARRVAGWLEGARDVTLVIGGSDGHGEAVRARAAETLSRASPWPTGWRGWCSWSSSTGPSPSCAASRTTSEVGAPPPGRRAGLARSWQGLEPPTCVEVRRRLRCPLQRTGRDAPAR